MGGLMDGWIGGWMDAFVCLVTWALGLGILWTHSDFKWPIAKVEGIAEKLAAPKPVPQDSTS